MGERQREVWKKSCEREVEESSRLKRVERNWRLEERNNVTNNVNLFYIIGL